MGELMTQEDFDSKLSEIIFRFTWMTKYPKRETEKEYDDCMDAVKSAYAAALARIASLEARVHQLESGCFVIANTRPITKSVYIRVVSDIVNSLLEDKEPPAPE